MFTYNIQLAGYPYEKFDDKGETNFLEFIHVFETFPWLEQLDESNRKNEGCAATISVNSISDQKVLWVSIAGDREEYVFLVGKVYFKTSKGLFGLGKEKTIKWVDIYQHQAKR